MQPMQAFADILSLLVTDPAAAADRLDALADELRRRAARLRVRGSETPLSEGGVGDRVTIEVVRVNGNREAEAQS